jgi:hypothetical protein
VLGEGGLAEGLFFIKSQLKIGNTTSGSDTI